MSEPSSSWGQRILRALLVLVVLALGGGVFVFLARTRPQAQRAPTPSRVMPVETITAEAREHTVVVRAQGQVIPARDLVLQVELNGRVLWRHPELTPGGTVRAGDTLVRIDPRDFRAAVAQQSAQLESQRVQVQTEQRRRAVAEREWELLARQSERVQASEEGRALSLREPQLRSAEASVDATAAQLAQARLTLSRTQLRAPFNALVRQADVEVGQLVGPSAQLATLVGTDHYWVQVSLPVESLAAIRVPGVNGGEGSLARVYQMVGARRVERRGRVVRLLGDLDPVGRMARVLVEIDDPLGLQMAPADGEPDGVLPILLGAYVHVEIDGGALPGTIEIPRTALRLDDTVWVVAEGRLAIRSVQIAWRHESSVLIGSGLATGDRVVTSPLAAPVEGTAVRIVEDEPTPTQAAPEGGTR
jgi:RND family efflux transporter MFP subunit